MKTGTAILATLLSTATFAQDSVKVKAGPVAFHAVPAIGGGVFVEDSKAESSDTNNGFLLVRLPAFSFPKLNDASVGVQAEVMNPTLSGFATEIVSYARVHIAGGTYAGANVRLFDVSKDGADFSLHASPVVGVRLLTLGSHIPVFFEVEFLGDRHPVKAAFIFTWE